MIDNNGVDTRLNGIILWLQNTLASTDFKIEAASSDASFRRYFRVTLDSETLIVMDAPPAQENIQPFIYIADFMLNQGIHVPKIIARHVDAGFLLLSDLGHQAYLDVLNERSSDRLYKFAINSLIAMQLMPTNSINLPCYDNELLHQEMSLFAEWFLNKHLAIESPDCLTETFQLLADNACEQPQLFVHRDYHSRNLMHTKEESPGIIDFQDAVIGPICYDLVSLLRDCYIEWPDAKIAHWIQYYYSLAIENELLHSAVSLEKFTQWFDWMGLQRHIKVLGIFARLNYRDGKTNYMNDLPLTLHYVRKIASKYPEFAALSSFLQQQQKIVAI